MESIKVKIRVGQDGILSLRLPIQNQEIEAMVIYQPVARRSHQDSRLKFKAILESYGDEVFSDSTELLREDRNRG
jgi:hypothetical protein